MKFPKRFFKQIYGKTLSTGSGLDIEFRCVANKRFALTPKIKQFWCRSLKEIEKCWPDIEDFNRMGYDVNFSVAPRISTPRGNKEHPLPAAPVVSCLWADLDVGNDKPHKTIEAALKRIKTSRPRPNMIVFSGKGLHPYFLLKNPRKISKERLETALRALAHKLNGDAGAARAGRLMRFPNSINMKYGKAGKFTRVEYLSSHGYRLKDLETLWKASSDKLEPDKKEKIGGLTYPQFFAQHLKRFRISGQEASALCPFHDDQNPSFSVNLDTGLWLCHSSRCSEKGNVVHFCRKMNIPLTQTETKAIGKAADNRTSTRTSSSRRDSQATRLVELAQGAKLFHTPDQEACATIKVDNHYEHWFIKDRNLKHWLGAAFYKRFGTAPTSQALSDALSVLEGQALYEGCKRKVFVRVAQKNNAVYLDLCDSSWRAVKITSRGWRVVSNPQVRFRRSRGMRPLPMPQRGGSIQGLRPFLNVATDNDFRLHVSWVLVALNPNGPYPPLVLMGEPGSAKSTTSKILRELIDPNTTPLRSGPRELRDLMIAARNSWCVAFDNVSRLSPWLSDALCSLATGTGFSTRQLYSDDEEKLFNASRPILMNGIAGFVSRSDLHDRSIIDDLPVIADNQRMTTAELWQRFRKARPRILGALLDAVSCALRHPPHLKLARLPRMADFATWITAAEPALGWEPGTFKRAYDSNRISANTVILEASPIAIPLKSLVTNRRNWSGQAVELLRRLGTNTDNADQQRDWPKSPWALSIELRRIAPNLRQFGINVRFDEKTAGSDSKRIITIEKIVNSSAIAIDRVERHRNPLDGIVRFPRLIRRFPR